ncbi:MAG: Asp-tRNA(Asn)/Glu-tRNA(Gln) amidotransferase subunit GatC [Bryobacterales bacterium]|nr:Asp-tRNA(Asn)/Glu-tRNA(Gln) amidotransferase subunit GatC [Bryobacterales bacterium]
MKLTEEQVRYVAGLANLALTEDEIHTYAHDLSDILTHIDKLNELNTDGVPPMAQVLFSAEDTATLREDEPHACLSNADAVANAPVTSQGYFKVPRVIER